MSKGKKKNHKNHWRFQHLALNRKGKAVRWLRSSGQPTYTHLALLNTVVWLLKDFYHNSSSRTAWGNTAQRRSTAPSRMPTLSPLLGHFPLVFPQYLSFSFSSNSKTTGLRSMKSITQTHRTHLASPQCLSAKLNIQHHLEKHHKPPNKVPSLF